MNCCSDPEWHFQLFLYIIQFLNFFFSDIKWNSRKQYFGIKDSKWVLHWSGVLALCQCISCIDFRILNDPFYQTWLMSHPPVLATCSFLLSYASFFPLRLAQVRGGRPSWDQGSGNVVSRVPRAWWLASKDRGLVVQGSSLQCSAQALGILTVDLLAW